MPHEMASSCKSANPYYLIVHVCHQQLFNITAGRNRDLTVQRSYYLHQVLAIAAFSFRKLSCFQQALAISTSVAEHLFTQFVA